MYFLLQFSSLFEPMGWILWAISTWYSLSNLCMFIYILSPPRTTKSPPNLGWMMVWRCEHLCVWPATLNPGGLSNLSPTCRTETASHQTRLSMANHVSRYGRWIVHHGLFTLLSRWQWKRIKLLFSLWLRMGLSWGWPCTHTCLVSMQQRQWVCITWFSRRGF